MGNGSSTGDPDGMVADAAARLVATYFERKDDLRRFIVARFGAEQADDLMQDLFVKVSQARPAAPVQNPGAYLYRLALNLTLDDRRTRTRAAARDASWRVIALHSVNGEDVVDEAAIEDVLTARRRLKQLVDAVDELPERTRQVFLLHKINGLTQAQTAGAVGISQRAVEKRIKAALTFLLAKVGRA